jgi:taurine dioxygenase
MTLAIEPHPEIPFASVGFGADLSENPERLGNEISRVLADRPLLLLPDQDLAPEQQLKLTRALGQPEKSWDRKSLHPDNPYIQVIESGKRPPGIKSTSQVWHTDQSFVERPPSLTILHAREVPLEGGETLFVDMHDAYDFFPEIRKEQLRRFHGIHSYEHVLGSVRKDRYSHGLVEDEAQEYPPVRHPLVRRNIRSGRLALYMNQLCLTRIEELEQTASDEAIEELYAIALAPDRVFAHRWRSGDVLIWDNASLMHRGSPVTTDERRLLHRTTISGERPV